MVFLLLPCKCNSANFNWLKMRRKLQHRNHNLRNQQLHQVMLQFCQLARLRPRPRPRQRTKLLQQTFRKTQPSNRSSSRGPDQRQDTFAFTVGKKADYPTHIGIGIAPNARRIDVDHRQLADQASLGVHHPMSLPHPQVGHQGLRLTGRRQSQTNARTYHAETDLHAEAGSQALVRTSMIVPTIPLAILTLVILIPSQSVGF